MKSENGMVCLGLCLIMCFFCLSTGCTSSHIPEKSIPSIPSPSTYDIGKTNTTTLPNADFEPSYDLYAYGDSTTEFSHNYLVQYQSLFEPAKTISYNKDGSGKNSTWGLENVRDNFHNNATDIYVMFGLNDMNTINATRVGINTDGICDAIEENGSVCHIMIHTMMANDTLWGAHSAYEIQVENITDEESYFDTVGRPYVKLYDAIDSVPCNDYPDPVNMSYMRDGAHPSITGHEYMARYLYNRTDYCSIYWSDKGAPTAPVTAFTSGI